MELLAPLCAELRNDLTPHTLAYPSNGHTYSHLLRVVLDALPQVDPFFLLAWSFSGPLALMIAAQRPANLRALILCASFDANPHPWFRWLAPLCRPALFRLFPFFAQARLLLGGDSTPRSPPPTCGSPQHCGSGSTRWSHSRSAPPPSHWAGHQMCGSTSLPGGNEGPRGAASQRAGDKAQRPTNRGGQVGRATPIPFDRPSTCGPVNSVLLPTCAVTPNPSLQRTTPW